ncbi:MAG: T9SS type A sorting domain-containing protein [Lewinellaceae bacterium]|nr:T9SS type A sorting domain-containing protein [Lewinellaceae bacterium]
MDDAGIGVVVHEVGHCLGLYHTFQGSEGFCKLRIPDYDDTDPAIYCDSFSVNLYKCGDCVPDTPTDPWLYFGDEYGFFTPLSYDSSTQTCSINPFQPFWDVDLNNYMSYYRVCYEHFTPGQVSRMKKVIHFVQYSSGEVDIDYRFMQNTLSDKLVITANTTWDEPVEVCTDVYIEAPNTLTITSTASMHSGVRFVVKPGAELRLEGGVMTKAGAGYWKGIEVWGDATATQVPNTGQGKLYIDGGLVEFATEAIVAFNPNAAGGDVESTSGGLVLAFDASFTNNARSAEFRKYGGQNYGRFVNCTFTIDGGHYGHPFREHIKLNGVHGLQFINCTFSNDTGAGNVFLGKGAGILSLDANFTVSGNQTVFRKLRYGVKASNAASAEAFAIKDATFSELEKGVLATGANHFTITRCTLLIGGHVTNLPPFLVSQEGVQVNYSTGFSIADNTCLGLAASQDSTVGIKVVDTGKGTDANVIYDNKFDTLYVGNGAIGDNVGGLTSGGIVYECNKNPGSNTFDFWVQEGGGITENQQSASSEAAGNTFSPDVIDNEGHFKNSGNIINYFFNNAESSEEPTQYTENRINLVSATSNDCSNGEIGGEVPVGDIELVKDRFEEAKGKHLLYKAAYEAALNDGDTPGLVAEVNAAKAWQAAALTSDLLALSPYVSQQVLQAVVDRPTIFTNSMQVDVLAANPDAVRKGGFLDYLEEHSSLNETELATVQAASIAQTARSALEASISAAYAGKHRSADLVLAYFLLDTAAHQTDSVLAWLDHKGSLHAAYLKADLLFQTGQGEAAQSALDSIPLLFQLSQEQQAEYSNKQGLFQLLDNQADILQMDSLAVDTLSTIAQEPGLAGLQAKSLLDYAYDVEMEPNHDLPPASQARTPVGSFSQPLTLANIRVYPNPSKATVTFEYTLLKEEKAVIRLLNTMGQLVTEIPLSSHTGLKEWDVSGLIEGVYWYQLWVGGKSGPMGKLAIQK